MEDEAQGQVVDVVSFVEHEVPQLAAQVDVAGKQHARVRGRVAVQDEDLGLAVQLLLRGLLLVVVVVLVGVPVLELFFLVVLLLRGQLSKVRGTRLQLLEGPPAGLAAPLVVLAPLVFVVLVVLVGPLRLHLRGVPA